MQVANANPPVKVTGRHFAVTEAISDYATKKIEHLHLDYPRIIEAQVILEVNKIRHLAEIVLHCSNHITIEATAETNDMYASLDEVMDKIGRQMRKYKTRILRSHRPRRGDITHLEEQVLALDDAFEENEHAEPSVIETERYPVKPMFVDEAVLQLEMSNRQFVVFLNARSQKVNVLYRRKSGNFGLMEPVFS